MRKAEGSHFPQVSQQEKLTHDGASTDDTEIILCRIEDLPEMEYLLNRNHKMPLH